jgi:soluble lytic murein transglycosylase
MVIITWRPFAFRDRSSVAAPITIPARMPSRVIFGIAASLLILAADAAAPAQAPPSTQQAPREEFLAAMQRVRLNLPEPSDSAALRNYSIYEYLLAARLRRDLSSAPNDALDTAVDGFLRAHSAQPVARALHREWLASLAQRRRWDWFLPRSIDVTDPQLVCDRLSGRLATSDTDKLGAEALARWSIPQRQPPECASVFAWLRTQGLVTPALEETRARAALAADNAALAREFIAEVPAQRAAPLMQWLQLLEAPRPSLNLLAMNPQLAVEPDALVSGFTHLSYGDSLDASTLLPLLLARPDMTPSLQGRLRRAAALGAAYGRQPGAVAAFNLLPPEVVDAQVQEWRVRAALWAGAYGQALQWIEQMPASLATQPRWRYWRARAVAAAAGAESAAPFFAEIAGLRDYYGYLAADRLHQNYDLNIHPTPVDAAVETALASEPGLIRAHALFDCDMADDAGAEWGAVIASAPPALKVQAAHLASQWGWYAQSIATLAQADQWDDVPLRYPRPYEAVIASASKSTQVPADWILAVIRQESLFRRDAVSRADARGLMQMQPATAAAVARRWHLRVPDRDSLFDPTVAIELGAAHLRELLDRYGNQLDLTLAAYNAGPVSVARWTPMQPIDADVWIENIPYGETRSYVQHVLEHIVAFAVVRNAEPPRLSGLLPPVMPAPPTAPASPAAPPPAARTVAAFETHSSH